MPPKMDAGWYTTHNDPLLAQYFDGKKWTDRFQPQPPTGDRDAKKGWYQDPQVTDQWRWWSGTEWAPARFRHDGRTSVVDHAGQSIVTIAVAGGIESTAVARLLEELRNWPPCRVSNLSVAHMSVVAGTNLVAVLEWDGPAKNNL